MGQITNNVYITVHPILDDHLVYGIPYNWNGIELDIPMKYDEDFKNHILLYLEPRKYINTKEVFIAPKFVHFGFEFGVRYKTGFSKQLVNNHIMGKLKKYFSPENREFNDIIDFRNIHNYIIHVSDNEFNNTKGIKNFVMRNQFLCTPTNTEPEYIFEPNIENKYPMYIEESFSSEMENRLRGILLNRDQFPKLIEDFVTIIEE